MTVTHLIFMGSFFIAMYHFYQAVMADPGFVNNEPTKEQQRQDVMGLADAHALDVRHFCVTCLVSKKSGCLWWERTLTNGCIYNIDQETSTIQALQDMQSMCRPIRPVS